MSADHDRHTIHRIVLPSGRAIQVVRFDTEPTHDPGLNVCPECASTLVQPVEWTEVEDGGWELSLRCPNCFWLGEGVFAQDEVDVFEERLEDGLTVMLSDLRRLNEANVAEEVERFAAALAADLILPEDF